MQNKQEKLLTVTQGIYTAVQDDPNHISILQDGNVVLIATCSQRKTKQELLEHIRQFDAYAKSGNTAHLLPFKS